ncbi:MAG: type II toxin-antitoxin system PemK/MazF family toxin [Gemmatimonadota bacterium]
MSRGDLVTVVLPGTYGKPRPALLIQDDAFEELPSATILPITSRLRNLPPLRIGIEPGPEIGLRIPSQVQIDKLMTVPRGKIGNRIGALDEATMERVEEALAGFLGLRKPSGESS